MAWSLREVSPYAAEAIVPRLAHLRSYRNNSGGLSSLLLPAVKSQTSRCVSEGTEALTWSRDVYFIIGSLITSFQMLLILYTTSTERRIRYQISELWFSNPTFPHTYSIGWIVVLIWLRLAWANNSAGQSATSIKWELAGNSGHEATLGLSVERGSTSPRRSKYEEAKQLFVKKEPTSRRRATRDQQSYTWRNIRARCCGAAAAWEDYAMVKVDGQHRTWRLRQGKWKILNKQSRVQA